MSQGRRTLGRAVSKQIGLRDTKPVRNLPRCEILFVALSEQTDLVLFPREFSPL